MKKLICFDVDGVLVNSELETLLVSWNEYNLWLQTLKLPFADFTYDVKDIPFSWSLIRKRLMAVSNKVYHRVATNILQFMDIIPNSSSFELVDEISSLDDVKKQETINRVQQIRDKLFSSSVYPSLLSRFDSVDYEIMQDLHDKGMLYFVTNNKFSIKAFESIAFKPSKASIFIPTDVEHNKSERLALFEHQVTPEKIMFIDDKVNSLLNVFNGCNIPKKNLIHNEWATTTSSHGFKTVSFETIINDFNNL